MYERGVLCRAFFPILALSISLFLPVSALSLSFFVSLRFRSCSPDLPVLLSSSSLSSDTRDQLANHFLLCNPASTRSALGLLTLFCFSASALLVLFCFFRFVQSSSPARESLAATRLPLEAAIQKKKIHFCVVRRHARRTFNINTINFFNVIGNRFTRFCLRSGKHSNLNETCIFEGI